MIQSLAIFIVLCSGVYGYCPRPLRNANTVSFIDDRYPLYRSHANTFPDGTTLVTRCTEVGRYRLKGSRVRTCTGGKWDAPSPVCEVSENQLIVRTDGEMEISNSGSIIFVADGMRTLRIICRIGQPKLTISLSNEEAKPPKMKNNQAEDMLVLSDPSPEMSGVYTCVNTLSNRDPATSVELIIYEKESAPTCVTPPAPENGKRSRPGMEEILMTTEIVYSCNDDYSLQGEQFSTCTSAGVMDSKPPKCIAYTCNPQPPETIDNGVVLGSDDTTGDTIGFLCNEGYNIKGEIITVVTCTDSLEWSAKFPKACHPNPTVPEPIVVTAAVGPNPPSNSDSDTESSFSDGI